MAITQPPTTLQVPVYYSAQQIGAAALLGGWTQADLETVIAVCLAESGGQANAIGSLVGGARAYGLMQVMWPTHKTLFVGGIESGRWIDGATNMSMARSVYSSQGWRAWEAYTNGRYRLFTGQAAAAAASLNRAVAAAGGQAGNVASAALAPAQGRIGAAQQQWAQANGGKAGPVASGGVLTPPANDAPAVQAVADVAPATTGALAPVVRLLEIGIGALLLGIGVWMFSRPVTDPVISAIQKLASGDTAKSGTTEDPARGGTKKKQSTPEKPAAAPAKKKKKEASPDGGT